jgi:outer membrane protein assembly factor BamB
MMLAGASRSRAQDWPQWRGSNRDGKASGFKAPETWPKALNQKWKMAVGRGDATPAVVGDKLFVFARDDAAELTVCLDAATGKGLWKDSYEAQAATEPMGKHPGPRSSPAVGEGKVVTYGARGTLSCLDATTGKKIWRKDDFGSWPKFFTSSLPLIVDGLCIAQLGGADKGGIVAYDLATGDQKWKWTDDGSAYSSPALLTVGGFGSVVDTGSALLALTPQGDLVVFDPSDKEYKNLATYKVGSDIYAYPVPSSRGLFVKDKDSLALWTVN